MRKTSTLQEVRKQYKPKLPRTLRQGISAVSVELGEATKSESDGESIMKIFSHTYGKPIATFSEGSTQPADDAPLKVGVVLSGGQAPGGHNVIAGIFDGIKNVNPDSELYGFSDGPSGLENGEYEILSAEKIDEYRNTGGFDIIGSGRTKLETNEQFDKCIKVITELNLDAVVVIGGDDSNTNAAILAEYLKAKGLETSVIGVPKTIDGDLKNKYIPTSFGFDTAVKTYSELVGNICRDSSSAKKYWHFIKLMGRSASHIALEVGLQTQPNVTLISEEIEEKNLSLGDVVDEICDSIVGRAHKGKNYGIVLVPEGLIEFIPSMKALIASLNDLISDHQREFEGLDSIDEKISFILDKLKKEQADEFSALPQKIQAQLLFDRDPHGNVQVSRIETEVLLIELVQRKLKILSQKGQYKAKFSEQHHFFGYEGRCAPPSNFDADYTYGLGYTAVVLIRQKLTGYMASISNLTGGIDNWIAGGIPITMMLNLERRHGHAKPVIKKALVELTGKPFTTFKKWRNTWSAEDSFVFPGPIQYFGPEEVCDALSITLQLESN